MAAGETEDRGRVLVFFPPHTDTDTDTDTHTQTQTHTHTITLLHAHTHIDYAGTGPEEVGRSGHEEV